MTLRFDGAWLGERRCFTEAHFSALVRKYRDSRLVTRAIFVGEFLSQLREAGLDPLLKGGSSLMFLLGDLRRLSEDVDIALADEAFARHDYHHIGAVMHEVCSRLGYKPVLRIGE